MSAGTKRFAQGILVNSPAKEQPPIHLMVALPYEAKPLIEQFGLSRLMGENFFPIFRNQDFTLTVSGVGKTAMAAALAYTHARYGNVGTEVWLNIGVAGHAELPVGEVCLVHKITDLERGRSWYPPIVTKPLCRTDALVTVSRPETCYERPELYDMEASAFYETACRFSSSELVQCIKVVSDNPGTSLDSIKPKQVSKLIESGTDLVQALAAEYSDLASSLQRSVGGLAEVFSNQWHFSVQQKIQLESILNRWLLLDPESVPDPQSLGQLENARRVLSYLRDQADRLPVTFP
jgi:nucleoside phosphorylase